MINKFGFAVLLLAVVGVLAGMAFATQITLADSSQAVTFTGTMSGADVTFTTLSGPGLFGSDLGHYTMTLTSGPIPLSASNVVGLYNVVSGGWTLSLSFTDITNPGMFSGTWNLATVSGGTTRVPQFIGSLLVASGTNQFQGWVGTTLLGDFSVNLGQNKTVNQIFQDVGAQTSGKVSSGELAPAPEPGALGLLGLGVLTLAGLLKRYSLL
jgi:hypothetical protein